MRVKEPAFLPKAYRLSLILEQDFIMFKNFFHCLLYRWGQIKESESDLVSGFGRREVKREKAQWKSIVDLFVFPQRRNYRNISNVGRKNMGKGSTVFLLLFLKYAKDNPGIFWCRVFKIVYEP